MSRYQPLADFLAAKKSDEWHATFSDIEARLGFPLPKSAYTYPAWWANQVGSGHSQTRGWRSVGWRTTALDLERRRVRFEREKQVTTASGPDGREGRSTDELLARARELTGISDREALIREALQLLVAREAGLRLARLGGTMPDFKAPSRERPSA
jgi:Bacterial antitoxin of type II TA system, VapB